jgi:hypothetical protein
MDDGAGAFRRRRSANSFPNQMEQTLYSLERRSRSHAPLRGRSLTQLPVCLSSLDIAAMGRRNCNSEPGPKVALAGGRLFVLGIYFIRVCGNRGNIYPGCTCTYIQVPLSNGGRLLSATIKPVSIRARCACITIKPCLLHSSPYRRAFFAQSLRSLSTMVRLFTLFEWYVAQAEVLLRISFLVRSRLQVCAILKEHFYKECKCQVRRSARK